MNPLALMIAAVVLFSLAAGKGVHMTYQAYQNYRQRGIRNHNPGNIRRSGDAWQGLALTQNDPEFFQFIAPQWGIRAMARLLRNYQTRHGLNTLRGIINRWAPASENPTAGYIANMTRWTGYAPDATLNLDDPVTMARIIEGIIRMENGVQPYPETLIREGITLANS